MRARQAGGPARALRTAVVLALLAALPARSLAPVADAPVRAEPPAAAAPSGPGWEAFARLAASATDTLPSPRVALARALLGRPYAANTLVGGPRRPERLVCRADSFDCTTLLDLLLAGEALARDGADSASAPERLREALVRQRYRNGAVDWARRLHFFSDWTEAGPRLVDAAAGFPGAETVRLRLNERGGDRRWLPGLPVAERTVHVAPPTAATLARLKPGDLLGFRATAAGLDVTHVAVVSGVEGGVRVIHASSRAGRVVEEPLAGHPNWPRGVLVLREAGEARP